VSYIYFAEISILPNFGNSIRCEQSDPANAVSATVCNFDPLSNAIDSSDLQSEKHPSLMTSTLAGMKRFFNPVPENARASIRG
jgi:hypothetical protein